MKVMCWIRNLKYQIALLVLLSLCSCSTALHLKPASHMIHESTRKQQQQIAPPSPVELPSRPTNQPIVGSFISKIDVNHLAIWLKNLTLFPDRYYQSQNGVRAAQWIENAIQSLPVPSDAKLTTKLVHHRDILQPSVIARYESKIPTTLKGIVITGSHFDTYAKNSPQGVGGPNPAADDCASGSAAVFEALRVLTTNGFIPGRPIEFHWYAGEEEGLYGSLDIANTYAAKGIEVLSYLNLDQSGYVKPGTRPEVGIYTDYTTSAATKFLSSIVSTYSGLPQVGSQVCGYACTDNASWFLAGYNTAMAFESQDGNSFPHNDEVHSDGSPLDTLNLINMTHVSAFAKITTGFVVELSLTNTSSKEK
ncbi:Zn-dependent exopeptidase, partial [Rhizoclosmatium globosum]